MFMEIIYLLLQIKHMHIGSLSSAKTKVLNKFSDQTSNLTGKCRYIWHFSAIWHAVLLFLRAFGPLGLLTILQTMTSSLMTFIYLAF